MLEIIHSTKDLLKSFASSAVTFATADNSIAATGIGTAFPTAGTKIVVSGASESANNITFTIVSATANKIIVTETVTAEAAGAAVSIEQEFQSSYKNVSDQENLTGTVYASQACTVYIDFSNDNGTNIDYTVTISVSADVAQAIDQAVLAKYARLRIRNGGTDQTVLRAYLYGKRR